MRGTGLVADDLYLLAHDDRVGRPLLKPQPLAGCRGLAAGLLAELMLGGSVALRYDGTVIPRQVWPADGLARHGHDQVAAEPEPHLVRARLIHHRRNGEVGGMADIPSTYV